MFNTKKRDIEKSYGFIADNQLSGRLATSAICKLLEMHCL